MTAIAVAFAAGFALLAAVVWHGWQLYLRRFELPSRKPSPASDALVVWVRGLREPGKHRREDGA